MESWKVALGGLIVGFAVVSGVQSAQAVGAMANGVVYGVGDSSGDEQPGSGVVTKVHPPERVLLEV